MANPFFNDKAYLIEGNYFLRVPINRIETSKYPAIMTKVHFPEENFPGSVLQFEKHDGYGCLLEN